MNLFYKKNYDTAPLLRLIDEVINPIRTEYTWGYSVEYYLSAINRCTPSYAGHFYNKHMLPIDQVAELLSLIAEEKKISFDRDYAEQLYLEYNARRDPDDTAVIATLKKTVEGKRVVLIAPGKSILAAQDRIRAEIGKPDTVSIALNNRDLFDTDYVFATRQDALIRAAAEGRQVITTSSVTCRAEENVQIINYQKWIAVDGEVQDSSGTMALNLLTACGAAELLLAGFDGFHVNVSKNYYDKAMIHPITAEQAEKRNAYYRRLIGRLRTRVPVTFLTPSLYEVSP